MLIYLAADSNAHKLSFQPNHNMKIYLAGTPGIESREREWQKILKRRLLSYWDIQRNQFAIPFAFNLIKERNENLSGKRVLRNE
jgi:hypothetical protein